MFRKLVNHNNDIRRLVDKGYAIAFDTNCLIVRDIPYLDSERNLQTGAIVTKLVFKDENRAVQDDHQIFFAGSHPHGLNGLPIPNLGGGTVAFPLSDASKDVVVQRSFSNKPKDTGKFQDFFEKIESYVTIISGPAMELHNASPYTYRFVDNTISDSVFEFQDTLTSRAGIADLSAKLKDDVIAIIGLGGTGSYILDFLVKTPVKEIRAFDPDQFYVHNAFRSPGRLLPRELDTPKADVYLDRYASFRKGLSITKKFIDASCDDDLDGITFAFVCVDKGSSRSSIFDLLIARGIPFIDVGMGLRRKADALSGMLRATYFPVEKNKELRDRGLAELADTDDDLYKANIQIGELNALNACLAIIRFKQIRGFYLEDFPYNHSLFNISDLHITSEEVNEN